MSLDRLSPDASQTTVTGREPMQRVRVGVTGLAFILLVVALATAIASGVRRTANASDTAPIPVAAVANGTGNATEKIDPLGKLGVTPPVDQAATAPSPPPPSPPPSGAPSR